MLKLRCRPLTFNLNKASLFFFFYLHFLLRIFTNHRTAGEGKGEGKTPHYHIHSLNRRLDNSRAITAESSPLHIASSRSRTKSFSFPSPICYTLSCMPQCKKKLLLKQKEVWNQSLCLNFWMVFEEKYFLFFFLTDQIPLPDCLFFLRYETMCGL